MECHDRACQSDSRKAAITPRPIVYLMRGLPSCGKSTTARRLAGNEGIVLETDQYFYTEVGDNPLHYDYQESLLPAAREWLSGKFQTALAMRCSPIVIDRGNGLNPETRQFAVLALEAGYDVRLAEPDSPWWQELRVLLKYNRTVNARMLDQWANHLAQLSLETHRVPAATIRRWMNAWKSDLTVEQIVAGDVDALCLPSSHRSDIGNSPHRN